MGNKFVQLFMLVLQIDFAHFSIHVSSLQHKNFCYVRVAICIVQNGRLFF